MVLLVLGYYLPIIKTHRNVSAAAKPPKRVNSVKRPLKHNHYNIYSVIDPKIVLGVNNNKYAIVIISNLVKIRNFL